MQMGAFTATVTGAHAADAPRLLQLHAVHRGGAALEFVLAGDLVETVVHPGDRFRFLLDR